MSVTRSRLVERLASSANITPSDADTVLSTVLGSIKDALVRGERVELRDFGAFSARERPAREARNPKTGEAVFVGKKKIVHFKVGKQLSQILNDDADALRAFQAKQHERQRRRNEKRGQLSLF